MDLGACRRVVPSVVVLAMSAVVWFAPGASAGPATPCGGLAPTIVGTGGDDNIEGTDGPDVIVAMGGKDYVYAGGGNDVVCGGDSDDYLEGGGGNDLLWGDDGYDYTGGVWDRTHGSAEAALGVLVGKVVGSGGCDAEGAKDAEDAKERHVLVALWLCRASSGEGVMVA